MKNKLAFILGSVLILLSTSCGTYRQVGYFQDLDRTSAIQEDIRNYTPLTVQNGDILGIAVTALRAEDAAPFNYNLNRVNGVNNDYSPTNSVVGFLVDQKGNIQLPYIGTIKVAGFTTTEIHDQLVKSLSQYMKDPLVNIRILNFKVSVLGDVLKPDVYTFQSERVTLTEALGMAGDLNITAKRTNVLLIREKDGKREFIPIDLTSKKLFQSPYYYLKNNDVIYVDPDRTKYAPVDRGYRTATLLVSGLSVIAILASAYFIQHK